MTIQSMTCCLQVSVLYQSATEVLCLTQPIDNSITIVTVINVCYQFSETVCSHAPTGAHLPFPPFQLQRQCIMQWYQGDHISMLTL